MTLGFTHTLNGFAFLQMGCTMCQVQHPSILDSDTCWLTHDLTLAWPIKACLPASACLFLWEAVCAQRMQFKPRRFACMARSLIAAWPNMSDLHAPVHIATSPLMTIMANCAGLRGVGWVGGGSSASQPPTHTHGLCTATQGEDSVCSAISHVALGLVYAASI